MTVDAEKVLAAGLQLTIPDRRKVAEELLSSLPAESRYEFDAEFWVEMDRRDREMDENPLASLSHEEVMASVREAIRCVSATTPAPEQS